MMNLDDKMLAGFALSVLAGVIAWVSLVRFMMKYHAE